MCSFSTSQCLRTKMIIIYESRVKSVPNKNLGVKGKSRNVCRFLIILVQNKIKTKRGDLAVSSVAYDFHFEICK